MYDFKITAKQILYDNLITPCPFCKSDDIWLYENIYYSLFFVMCGDCGAMGPAALEENNAVKSWDIK